MRRGRAIEQGRLGSPPTANHQENEDEMVRTKKRNNRYFEVNLGQKMIKSTEDFLSGKEDKVDTEFHHFFLFHGNQNIYPIFLISPISTSFDKNQTLCLFHRVTAVAALIQILRGYRCGWLKASGQ